MSAVLDELRSLSDAVRRMIVERSLAANVGHVGSALSVVEMLAVLWGSVLRGAGTTEPRRDRFILSKGHAALALYAVLRQRGLLTERELASYCRDGSPLGVHPEQGLPGVEVGTGSLGQGLSVGCGLAYALREEAPEARVFVLLSDAECNEGQVWEAVMFAAQHRLVNMTALIDLNGMQALGPTRDVLDLSDLAGRWRAFGWDAVEVDGHDVGALRQALSAISSRPGVVLARTVLGKGVSFMEGRLEWHYRNLTSEQARDAAREIEARHANRVCRDVAGTRGS